MEFQNICNEMVAPFLLRHPVYSLHKTHIEASLLVFLLCLIEFNLCGFSIIFPVINALCYKMKNGNSAEGVNADDVVHMPHNVCG